MIQHELLEAGFLSVVGKGMRKQPSKLIGLVKMVLSSNPTSIHEKLLLW
jgi:hypothetical protein